MFYLYQLKTTACNKYYIGITTNPDRRFRQHMQVAKHKWKTLTKCGRAVKRYGADTFSMRILEKNGDKKVIVELEVIWIKRFGMKRLWNSSRGGEYK